MKTYSYPATFEPGEALGTIVVTFTDVPEAITQGDGPLDARVQAADALGLALLTILEMNKPLPTPSTGPIMISPEPQIAAKLAVIETFAQASITRTELARRLGKQEKEVRRILDPMEPTKLPVMAQALVAMNARLVVGLEIAA